MAAKEVAEEFKPLTPEEVERLPVFPEPAETEDVDGAGPGYVYLMKAGPNYFKVGQTRDPRKRRSDLQTGNPQPLEYLRCVEVTDMDASERAVQGALYNYRSTLGGGTEWFTAQQNQVNTLVKIFNRNV